MHTEKENKKKVWASWILWIVLILVLSRFMGGGQDIDVTIETDGMSFTTDSGYTAEVKWDEIAAVEVREDFSFGTLVEGTDNSKEKSGIWTNEEFGEYELIADARISNCVVCFMDSGSVVAFNYEGEETTRGLYEAIQEELEET